MLAKNRIAGLSQEFFILPENCPRTSLGYGVNVFKNYPTYTGVGTSVQHKPIATYTCTNGGIDM